MRHVWWSGGNPLELGSRGSRSRRYRPMRGFHDFAATDTRRADLHMLRRAVDHRADVLQVDVPTPLGDVVGVAHPVTELGTTTAEFTYLRHD